MFPWIREASKSLPQGALLEKLKIYDKLQVQRSNDALSPNVKFLDFAISETALHFLIEIAF